MRQLRADEGGRPWCLQPELTEGCSMKYGNGSGGLCSFCGLNAIREGPGNYKYMTLELASRLAADAGSWCPKVRVEFAMRGEPLMNPNHLEIFQVFRKSMPKAQLMVTTNGDTIRTLRGAYNRMQERVDLLFEAGLNFILLDTYMPKERRHRLREEAYALKNVDVIDYFNDWMPVGLSPYHNHGTTIKRTVVLMDDLAARDREHSSRMIKTHAGSNPTHSISSPLSRNCGRPFREITVAWNGDVTLCCDDWRKQYIVGNVSKMSLSDIWKDEKFEAARARLFNKDRTFGPCAECDAPSAPRSSLLPVYETPSKEDLRITDNITRKNSGIIPLWSK